MPELKLRPPKEMQIRMRGLRADNNASRRPALPVEDGGGVDGGVAREGKEGLDGAAFDNLFGDVGAEGGAVLESMAGASADQPDIFVIGMTVDDEVFV